MDARQCLGLLCSMTQHSCDYFHLTSTRVLQAIGTSIGDLRRACRPLQPSYFSYAVRHGPKTHRHAWIVDEMYCSREPSRVFCRVGVI
jgi:hypothetical protein